MVSNLHFPQIHCLLLEFLKLSLMILILISFLKTESYSMCLSLKEELANEIAFYFLLNFYFLASELVNSWLLIALTRPLLLNSKSFQQMKESSAVLSLPTKHFSLGFHCWIHQLLVLTNLGQL